MKAADLYAKTLQGYSSLQNDSKVSLSRYCKEHRVNYCGLRNWMKEESISMPKSKEANVSVIGSFVPVSILPSLSKDKDSSSTLTAGLLKGVTISLSNGHRFSIRELSGRDFLSIIHTLTQPQSLCLP